MITDAPTDNNGKGEAFSPTDLVATALGSCIITIMGIKAQSLGFELPALTCDIQKTMAANPRRIAAIDVNIQFIEDVPQAHRDALERAGRACPVAKSLHPDLEQTIRFTYP